MAAAVADRSKRSGLGSLHFLCPLLGSALRRELTCLLAVLCVLLSRSAAAAAGETDFVTEEFLKKEFSLAKPYRGEWSCQRPGPRRNPPGPAQPSTSDRVNHNQDN